MELDLDVLSVTVNTEFVENETAELLSHIIFVASV